MTLTQAAFLTKRGIVIFIGVIFLGFLVKLVFDIGFSIYRTFQPPPEEKPNIQFGILPSIIFPTTSTNSNTFTYSLDTQTGTLPAMPKIAKVYFNPPTSASLLSSQRTKQLAETLGFPIGPEILSDTLYRFSDNNGGTITIDISTNNFSFQRPKSTEERSENILPDPAQVVTQFRSYLSSKGLSQEDIEDSRSNVVYDGPSQSESETATVSIWQKPLDEIPIVTAEFKHGLIKAVVTKSSDERGKFIKVDYVYWPIDRTSFSTYPLKKIDDAFNELKSGNAYVAYSTSNTQVSLTNIYIAYFLPNIYAQYIQPVYVFEGPQFAAYVPAVNSTYIQQ